MKIFQISLNTLFATSLLFMATFGHVSLQADNGLTMQMETLDSCPTASFSIANNGVAVGTAIQFNNQSTDANSYHWDFGDGNFSCAENPSHVYTTAGNYTVKLVVFGDGCTVSFIGTDDVIIL